MTTLPVTNSIHRSPLWLALLVIPLALTRLALLPTAQAVTPPPDGGYPNENTAEGERSLFSLTTGSDNTAIGFEALRSNTTGFYNTASGAQTLLFNTAGIENTADGAFALQNNTTGSFNTASGAGALENNTTGHDNTANGVAALVSNRTGFENTANGVYALESNTSGRANVANGYGALAFNTTGFQNTAIGAGDSSLQAGALAKNTTGIRNTATGNQALFRNQTGNGNTAEGFQALANNTGSFNVAVGFTAGANLTTGRDNIDIGALGVAGESNTMRIGTVKQTRTFIAGIRGVTTANANAVPVVIDSAGQLGTLSSSRRFKDGIEPMGKTSEALLSLKPVTFHYKTDTQGTPQFGLIAEEVAKVNPDLVVRDDQGEIYTVRYEAVNAMLLNEFLKEHRKVESLEAAVARQQKEFQATIAQQQKQIEALTAGLQKVTAQVASTKPAPRIAINNH